MTVKAENLETDLASDEALNLKAILGLKRNSAVVIEAGQTIDGIEGYDDTVRWPIWKTTLLVVSLCAGFWICAAALALAFLG